MHAAPAGDKYAAVGNAVCGQVFVLVLLSRLGEEVARVDDVVVVRFGGSGSERGGFCAGRLCELSVF